MHLFRWWTIFLGSLAPLVWIVYQAFNDALGAEPAKELVEFLGEIALYILFITLAITPLRKIRFLPSLVRYRRMIGLYAFFYAVLHISGYAAFIVDWSNFVEDIYKRPYVTMGFLAFLILFALAVTSPKSMLRKLGKKWKPLHRLVYLAVILVIIHVWWQTRSDYTEVVILAGVTLFLLAFRAPELKRLRSN